MISEKDVAAAKVKAEMAEAFEKDMISAKKSDRLFRVEHSPIGSKVLFLTDAEISDAQARTAAESAERKTMQDAENVKLLRLRDSKTIVELCQFIEDELLTK